eukprot:352246-Chlamydomonas_euryale.AAC.3
MVTWCGRRRKDVDMSTRENGDMSSMVMCHRCRRKNGDALSPGMPPCPLPHHREHAQLHIPHMRVPAGLPANSPSKACAAQPGSCPLGTPPAAQALCWEVGFRGRRGRDGGEEM